MMTLHLIRSNDVLPLFLQNKYRQSKPVRKASLLASVLLAQACSSGSQKNITPAPKPDFVENPSGTFRASTAKNNVLNRAGDNRDLIVYGHDGQDTITTGIGADTIEGRGGNDTINSGAGDDTILGGDGDDVIDGGDGVNNIKGGNGNDTITSGVDGSSLDGDDGDDIITSGIGSDSINGGAGNDTITSTGGLDHVKGGDGNDTITLSGDVSDVIEGDAGDDIIWAADTNDLIFGDDGNDTINGGGGEDIINGNKGNDTINAGDGTDYIRAGEGVDTVDAGNGDDYILVVGITEEDQFSEIELIALSVIYTDGLSLNLAQILTAININGRTTSELQPGEIIDGGAGTNVLILYGDSDLNDATLINLYELDIIGGSVGVSTVQIAEFDKIDSDEDSVIALTADEENLTVDLSSIDISNLGELTVPDGVTLTMHDISDIQGITNITSSDTEGYTVQIIAPEGTPTLEIALSDLSDIMQGVLTIELGPGVVLNIESLADVAQLGVTTIIGEGEVIFDALVLSLDDLAKLAADLSFGDGLSIIGLFGGPILALASMAPQLSYQGDHILSPEILDTLTFNSIFEENITLPVSITVDEGVFEQNYSLTDFYDYGY